MKSGTAPAPPIGNFVDHLAAVALERALEGGEAVLAGREIGVADHRGLGIEDPDRGLAHGEGRVPHAERDAHIIGREVGDMRRAGVHDHRKLPAGGNDRRGGDRIGRIDPAGDDVDIVLGEQLLHRQFGIGAGRVLHVALDQLDRVRLDLVGIELEVKLGAAVHLLRDFRGDAGIGHVDADLHLLRGGEAASNGERGARRDDAFHHGDPSPTGSAGHELFSNTTAKAANCKRWLARRARCRGDCPLANKTAAPGHGAAAGLDAKAQNCRRTITRRAESSAPCRHPSPLRSCRSPSGTGGRPS